MIWTKRIHKIMGEGHENSSGIRLISRWDWLCKYREQASIHTYYALLTSLMASPDVISSPAQHWGHNTRFAGIVYGAAFVPIQTY